MARYIKNNEKNGIEIYLPVRLFHTPFTKYFFYIFYPLHLWVIAIINYVFVN